MAVEIKKIYKEHMPSLRFIGKRYTDSDRQDGSFGAKWREWFGNGYFDVIEKLGASPKNGDSYLGAMRVLGGEFEYWIGMLFPIDTQAPEGFESADIASMDIATCWLYGKEKNGELFGLEVHEKCVEEMAKQGFVRKGDDWCFERYNCPRFTSPDEKGNVILDYCIAIESTGN